MTESSEYQYDFAVSYAGPDTPIVEKVVAALRARGLRVFFAPDEQADIVGHNLIDYLSEVYLTKARYCFVFISKHYAERQWTNRVERPAAQARAIQQNERYILPVRLDNAKITGLLPTTAEIRDATPGRIADLAVAILLRDQDPAAVTESHEGRDRLVLRVLSFTEFDEDLLRQSFKPFIGWVNSSAHMIPVEMRIPEFLQETLLAYKKIQQSADFQRFDSRTKEQFSGCLKLVDRVLFKELLAAPATVLVASQLNGATALQLTDSALSLIRRYVLAKIVAVARCLASHQLIGFSGPNWARNFADCDVLWSPRLMEGLAWLCRSEGSERHLWLDADIYGWGHGAFDRVRIDLPSVMFLQGHDKVYSEDEVLRFVAPQLLQRQIEHQYPFLLHDAFHYPERMQVQQRNEWTLECHHFRRVSVRNFGLEDAVPAITSLRDEITNQKRLGEISVMTAHERMRAARSALGHDEIFDPVLSQLFDELMQEPRAS